MLTLKDLKTVELALASHGFDAIVGINHDPDGLKLWLICSVDGEDQNFIKLFSALELESGYTTKKQSLEMFIIAAVRYFKDPDQALYVFPNEETARNFSQAAIKNDDAPAGSSGHAAPG